MKTLIAILFMMSALFICVAPAHGQIVLPKENPQTTLIQDLGFNRITVEYTRPSTKGHVIFGEKVPYGEPWLDGDVSIHLSVAGTLLIEDSYELSGGNYFLQAIPGQESWTMIIREGKLANMAPVANWDEEAIYSLDNRTLFEPGRELFRFDVVPEKMNEKVESLTVQFANVCSTCASMQIMWDYTRVSFGVSTEVDAEIVDEIERFTNNPELKMAGQYYLAAKYYLETNRDLDKALVWVDKSLEYTPDAYWVLHTKAEILAAMENYKEAINVAEESIEIARKKSDMDYIRMNEMEIERWKDMRKGGM